MRTHFWLSRPPEGLDRIEADYYAVTNWMALGGLFFHVGFLVAFTILGPSQLALLNIWSVLMWGVTLALARRGQVKWAFAIGTLEVVVHSAYATLLLGWGSAFQAYYLVAALLWLLNRAVSMRTRLAIAISLCVAVVAGASLLQGRPPPLEADPLVVSVFGVLNLAISLILAFGVALYLPLVIDHARAQLKEAIQAGSYELQRVLDRGGMGEVWLARHRMLVRPAAVKLVRQEEASAEVRGALKERFEREAQATAALRSVHTVELYDFGLTDDGSLYYAMELLDGIDLDKLVKMHGPVDPGRVVYLLRQVCDSLADAHANGLVHRDIKPANLYICRMGTARDFVKVLDFGLVKSTDEAGPVDTELTALGSVIGTPAFMAPEQVRRTGEIDARADLYALGCVAWWLLTGRLVFEADTPMDMAVAHLTQSPDPPSKHAELAVPKALDAVVMQCLEKDPGDRPQTALAMREALLAIDIDWDNARATSWWDAHQVEQPSLPADRGIPMGSSRFIRKEMG
ncbi:MAG: serine/threonine protein kinase [Deltaproteobacteria bacterium]|nr:serine/threonine protein kinase [Deltaproteobacteria bacterium]